MAEGLAARSSRGIRTICVPICEEEYRRIIDDAPQVRRFLDRCYEQMPELFPEGFSRGYQWKDGRVSEKAKLRIRRVELRNGTAYSIRATTVGGGCCLGVAVAESAGTEELTEAYGVFRQEALDVNPQYAPKSVNTDGWKGTKAAWKALFLSITIVQCFLHGWLKIRDRAKHLKECFTEISQRVWDAYHAPDRRSFSQRIASLQTWARKQLRGVVLENVVDLCDKRDRWKIAYDHPECHRTSNMLDRIMRSMNRYFDNGQHLHGSLQPSRLHCRAWALLYNFTPWNPATARKNGGWKSPAERLNKHRYHDNWLHNLLVSASLGGYRNCSPQIP